jgi:hypothetical protein
MQQAGENSWIETHGFFVGNLDLRMKNEENDLC